MKKQKAETFDPEKIRAEKLTWVRKAVRDVRKCAAFYGMPQDELDRLAEHLRSGGP